MTRTRRRKREYRNSARAHHILDATPVFPPRNGSWVDARIIAIRWWYAAVGDDMFHEFVTKSLSTEANREKQEIK